jgi:hypothetical protein
MPLNVSADFSSPYATASTTPLSASLQNEGLRGAGYYLPDAGKYVTPNSLSVDAAFAITAPTTTSTWAKWDVYGINYGTKVNHGVTITGKSQLGLPLGTTAYPISGTTFAYLYSCYASAAQVTALGDWLAWLLGSSVSTIPLYNNTVNNRSHPGRDLNVNLILANNGFHGLHLSLAKNLLTEYVVPSNSTFFTVSTTAISAIGNTQSDGCTDGGIVVGTGAN